MDPDKVGARSSNARTGGVRTRGGRLPPIMTRDLGPTKKSFTPNIPQRRVKVKEENQSKNDIRGTRDSGKYRSDDRRKDRGRGRGRREYVQTAGAIFGEGISSTKKPSRDGGALEYTPKVYKPVFQQSKRKSAKEIDEMNRGLEDDEEYGSSSDGDDYFDNAIIRLPLKPQIIKKEVKKEIKKDDSERSVVDEKPITETSLKEVKMEVSEVEEVADEVAKILSSTSDTSDKAENVPMKTELTNGVVKTEPMDEDYTEKKLKIETETVKFKTESHHEFKPLLTKTENLMKGLDDGDQLLFIQFPSCLPFEKMNLNDPQPGPSSRLDHKEDIQQIEPSELKDMNEGLIGKLQFLKSGDVRLCIGNAMMGLHCDDRVGFLQQVVTIETRGEESGDVTVIGNIDKGLMCYPVAEDYLDKIKPKVNY